jgi:hypothetical protein
MSPGPARSMSSACSEGRSGQQGQLPHALSLKCFNPDFILKVFKSVALSSAETMRLSNDICR